MAGFKQNIIDKIHVDALNFGISGATISADYLQQSIYFDTDSVITDFAYCNIPLSKELSLKNSITPNIQWYQEESADLEEVVFVEDMGQVSSTTLISIHESADGFENDNYTMSGTADIRATTPSTTYPQASGDANVFFTAEGRYFQIEGINTIGLSSLALSFGVLATVANNMLTVEVSEDGTNWTALTVNSTISANTWTYKTATGTIPSCENLRIRWTSPNATQYRLDDATLYGLISGTAMPNLLLQYRVQVPGEIVDETWKSLICNTPKYNYASGILNQICNAESIEIIENSILQIRISRDIPNDSNLFAGECQFLGNIKVLSFFIE